MKPEQVSLIQSTADALFRIDGQVSDSFYDHLFALAPETRSLFAHDLGAQKLKLANMLATLIGAIDRPEMFSSIVEHLGRRHARYGVASGHYQTAGMALMKSLEDVLGDRLLRTYVRLGRLRIAGWNKEC